jgi:hypothetical protein
MALMANRPANRSRFEVPVSTQRSRGPRDGGSARFRNERRTWFNAGIVAAAIAITTVSLLAISGQIYDTTNANLVPQTPAPLVAGVITSPSPLATASPTPTRSPRAESTPSPESEATAAPTPDDTEIQAAVDAKLNGDQSLVALGITATVNEGRVILVGTAPTDELKSKVEKLVRSVKGVKQVDNQIAVVVND